ncbi:MAG: GH32 C-terminal domain-containing protein [Muribaculaceae bacterium]|nr:GH32 C-terminal domain-containing protein [Muribaculaceae bacterium]
MKNIATFLLAALFALTAAASGPEAVFLGTNHALLRVDADRGKYLLMPVQETIEDSKVNIIVDGHIDKTIYVRLAKYRVDHTVPFDLSPYKGHTVVFSIETSQSRSSVREAKEDACWSRFAYADTFDTSNREKYRPAYHHTPLYGWMNDPNGMFYADGTWHLYYQYNPYGSKWQNMTWGHSTSTDLVHWQHLPLAIEPDALGTIFSGSCAIDSTNSAGFGKNAVIAMYTSADRSQTQSLAHSTDGGLSFVKYPGNPAITMDSEARDPNFFFDKESGEWKLVLAHALNKEMVFFSSPDLKNWTYTGAFGKGLGAQNGVWECPDLFQLPVKGTDMKKWMLICNINPGGPFGGSATQYFIGEFDGKTFKADEDADGNVPVKWLDYGKDFYATVTWNNAPQGRRTAIGWMSNWQYAAEVPTSQYRSANTLPREIELYKGDDGQIYAASLPSPEIDAIRGNVVSKATAVNIGAKARSYKLPASGLAEICIDLNTQKATQALIKLSNNFGEEVLMTYDPTTDVLSFDRKNSGLTDFSQDFPDPSEGKAFSTDGALSLRIFIDHSSIEIFANDGRLVMTNLVFPRSPYTTLSVSDKDGATRIDNLKIYDINI